MSFIPIIYLSNILDYLDLHGIKPADYIICNYYLCLGVYFASIVYVWCISKCITMYITMYINCIYYKA